MYPTVEARWFLRGRLPKPVTTWYAALPGAVDAAESRIDHYLRLDNGEAVGVKLREGRVEVKRRVQTMGVASLQAGVEGRLEYWRKWSFALAAKIETAEDAPAQHEDWLAVSKSRQLRRYLVQNGRLLTSLPESAERGCEVELAQVSLEQTWWSIALEAFGPASRLRHTLLAVAEHLFVEPPPFVLPLEASYAYPRWLVMDVAPPETKASAT